MACVSSMEYDYRFYDLDEEIGTPKTGDELSSDPSTPAMTCASPSGVPRPVPSGLRAVAPSSLPSSSSSSSDHVWGPVVCAQNDTIAVPVRRLDLALPSQRHMEKRLDELDAIVHSLVGSVSQLAGRLVASNVDSPNLMASQPQCPLGEACQPSSMGRIHESEKKTVYLCDLSEDETRGGLVNNLRVDFFYVYTDFKTDHPRYALLNFVSHDDAAQFLRENAGRADWGEQPHHHSKAELSKYYRNSFIMHHTVPDRFRPRVLDESTGTYFSLKPEPGDKVPVPNKTVRPLLRRLCQAK